MGIHVLWDNDEKTIVRMDFEDWQWTDVHGALETFHTLAKSVNQPVQLIANMKNANVLPLEGAMTNLQHVMNVIEHKIVFVSAKSIGKAIFEVLSKVNPSYKEKLLYVETLDEARALLARLAKQGD
jgi:hypothetical protein